MYHIRGFLLGPNYHVDRQRLEDVLTRGGPLPFQHPYRGLLRVKLHGKYTVTESDTQGGMATFDFTLVEAGGGFPQIYVATAAKVSAIVTDLAEVTAKKTKFSLLGAIQDVVHSVTNALGRATSGMRKVNGKIGAGLSLIDDASFVIQSFDDQIELLKQQPSLLVNKFIALKSSLMGLIKEFEPPKSPVDVVAPKLDPIKIALDAFRSLNEFEAEPEAIPTPTEQFGIEETCMREIQLADRIGNVAYAADTLAALEMTSATQAADVQAELVNAFDEILVTSDLDTGIAESVMGLKAATIEHFTAQQLKLPDLAVYPVQKTLPALIVAYELYEDANRVEEIVERNRIRHPGFTPGGIDLEVLAQED